MRYVAAIDVGGTFIKAALVSENLEIIEKSSTNTPKNDLTGEATATAIAELVKSFESKHPVDAVGFAVPGAIDEVHGVVRWAGNLQWKNIPIRALVEKATHKPVAFKHDVRTGMVAEQRKGAAHGFNQSIFIPIGTGFAAAFVIDGEIRSSDGYAGEIGHVNVGGPRACVCGKSGCLEAISSALAISNNYREKSGKDLTSAEIVAAAEQGDATAQEVWNEAVHFIGVAIEMLITTLAPEVIVFGGGVSKAGNSLLAPLEKYLDDRLTFQRRPALRIAHFGSDAGTIGCALIAFDRINS